MANDEEKAFQNAEIRPYSASKKYKSQPIIKAKKPSLYPYDLFENMRNINKHSKYYYSLDNVFVNQGKFMQKFTDDYQYVEPFQCVRPVYGTMTNEQLRTYFSWRTLVRKKVVKQIPSSYIYLYIFEIINNIGVKNTADAVEILVFLLKEYARTNESLQKKLVAWIKDYYICNCYDMSFIELIKIYQIEKYYAYLMENDNVEYEYQKLSKIANYKFSESRFYSVENQAIVEKCFNEVMKNLLLLFQNYGVSLNDLIMGDTTYKIYWKPYCGAVYSKISGTDRVVTIGKSETYICHGTEWEMVQPIVNFSSAPGILGYIIMSIESHLRNFKFYKPALTVDVDRFRENLHSSLRSSETINLAVSDSLFTKIIDNISAYSFNDDFHNLLRFNQELSQQFASSPYVVFENLRTNNVHYDCAFFADFFVKEAKKVVNITDDFAEIVPCARLKNLYSTLSNDQLRCYFTWRTKARKGCFYGVDEAYVYLYCNELINNIGARDENEVVEKLTDVLKNCQFVSKFCETFVVNCIKDYYICNDFHCSFYELITKLGIENFYLNVVFEFSDVHKLDIYAKLSNYDIYKSKFYNAKTAKAMGECLAMIVDNVSNYYKDNGKDFKKCLAGRGTSARDWTPFCDGIYSTKATKTATVVELCSNEKYAKSGNRWVCKMQPEKDISYSFIVGYMIKLMECDFRKYTKFKYKLSTNLDLVLNKITRHKVLIASPKFTEIISRTVREYLETHYPNVLANPNSNFEKPVPIKVEIDTSKLNKIRMESDEIREKLTVQEQETYPEYSETAKVGEARVDFVNVKSVAEENKSVKNDAETAKVGEVRADFVDVKSVAEENKSAKNDVETAKVGEVRADFVDVKSVGEENKSVKNDAEIAKVGDNNSVWVQLFLRLSQLQKNAVANILDENFRIEKLMALANENNVLIEVLLESINEIALQCIGDNIIETAENIPYIYQEYLQDIMSQF